MSMLDKLREQYAAVSARVQELAAKDGELSAEDRAAGFADIELLDELGKQIRTLEDVEAREVAAAASVTEERVERGAAVVTREERTYTPDAERREGRSFLRDVFASKYLNDPSASQRLGRHMAEERVERGADLESRDIGTGAAAGLTVPQYLVDLAAPLARAGRPVANICNAHPLPADGMAIVVSRVTTGTAAAVQATENAGVQETNLDDTALSVDVRTIAGQQDVSRQLVERSTGADSIVISDLIAAYHTKLDSSIINDDGNSGTHLGIRSTTSIVAVSYTDDTPTAAELYPKLFDLQSQVQAGVYMGISHFVMHPRRWNWLASQVGSTFPFLQIAGINQQGGEVSTREYGGVVGSVAGVPVIVDGNIPTNISSTQDVILGVTASELHLWEDASAPMFIRAEDVGSGNLTVKFVVYGYSAFTAGRYPGAHGTISGTGTTTPSF